MLTAPAYRVELSRKNGAVLALRDLASGTSLVRGSVGCLWGAAGNGGRPYVGGCSGPFSYRWNARASTLTLRYRHATATLRAADRSFDLRLTLRNALARPLRQVGFPVELVVDVASVRAGYAPTYLPGIRLGPEFFARPGNNVRTYPSRWAFAAYLGLDLGGSHVAVSSVDPQPVSLGFVHNPSGYCSGPVFCVAHVFETWIEPGATWRSPVVRVRVGGDVRETLLAYRRDAGIEHYPSARDRLGPLFPQLARAPLVKADVRKGLAPFRDWAPDLTRLPSPSLIHPVSFQPGGHDESFPDFLPPDPAVGTTEEFRLATAAARARGQLVMPYLNVSWWDDEAIADPAAVALRDQTGAPRFESYNGHRGVVVSPHAPAVTARLAELMERWRSEVPADCLFFDQIGARPWLRDFHPDAPTPVAYDDGWLALMRPYADRCLMVEDGWDRLAESFAAFHGGFLMMAREHDEPNRHFGEGTWEPYPLATWLLHDKVLMYQHDLFEGTFADDAEVVMWNLSLGLLHTVSWEGWTLGSPWIALAGALQDALGPHYAGVPLGAYRELAPGVTESVFGGLSVIANRSGTATYRVAGFELAPHGFLARGPGVLAAGLAAEDGVRYVVEAGGRTTFDWTAISA